MGQDIKQVLAPETTGSSDNLIPFSAPFFDQQHQLLLYGLNSLFVANQEQVQEGRNLHAW